VGANFLTSAPGYRDAGDVAQALWELATHAAERRDPAWSPDYDELKARLRARLTPGHRELYDVFAPSSERDPDPRRAEALVLLLIEGGRALAPLMEPRPFLGRVRHPVELLHGRGDRLIPFTESARLRECLPTQLGARATVTRLFAHSSDESFPLLRGVGEAWTFLRALRRVLGTV
jgi:pimeloyl-ACP methyl ester carboxylesterase